MMIDAGSTGTRLHIYEFEKRHFTTLPPPLSYPFAEESHWTSRVAPGISVFADVEEDDELEEKMRDYFRPFFAFTTTILGEKEAEWATFPIYLKATGGMRALSTSSRNRVITTVRSIFGDPTFNPFYFTTEQARVISGEEEAIYGWTGINFLMGTLLNNTRGEGTVTDVNKTFGALDMGGASTQISFYEPNEDVMSNLFKMQLGASKHWNVYAHSFLYFGNDLARERVGARIVYNYENEQMEGSDRISAFLRDSEVGLRRLQDEHLYETSLNSTSKTKIYNPCLPGAAEKTFRSRIRFNPSGIESWSQSIEPYKYTFVGGSSGGNFEECANLARTLLRKNANEWCNFEHKGDCSFAGVYQPPLPTQSRHFGEFFGFANYLKLWKFLRLKPRSTLEELRNGGRSICAMSKTDLGKFAGDKYLDENGNPVATNSDYCFLACYAFELLHTGYGFKLDDHITVANVINGQKVGWALGSVLYEINALPWKYNDEATRDTGLGLSMVVMSLIGFLVVVSYRLYRSSRQLGELRQKVEGAKSDPKEYSSLL